MPNQKPLAKSKSTEEILREMEEMTHDAGSHSRGSAKSGGAIKSLMDFFVKIEPDELPDQESAPLPKSRGPVQSAPATGAAASRGPRVSDLVAGEPAPQFSAPPQVNAGNLAAKPFDEIYREAGLGDSPCSVDELAKLMENPTVANQPLSVKVVAVSLALTAKGMGVDTPISDAVRRDRALDAYQRMLSEHASTVDQQNAAKIQKITQETEEYLKRKQTEMEALRAEIAEAKRQSVDFSQRRQTEEKRLADLISPFLEGKANPVTIGDQGFEPKQA
ncbi:MAG TPA: hypothetical protein VFC63_26595 [Blastocatellia bacterium]|nr:hypothetical protein [Blastocatellia bacterium]